MLMDAMDEDGSQMTRRQLRDEAMTLFLAGHETTINLICNGALAFLQHPDQWRLFKQDPGGMAKAGGSGLGSGATFFGRGLDCLRGLSL